MKKILFALVIAFVSIAVKAELPDSYKLKPVFETVGSNGELKTVEWHYTPSGTIYFAPDYNNDYYNLEDDDDNKYGKWAFGCGYNYLINNNQDAHAVQIYLILYDIHIDGSFGGWGDSSTKVGYWTKPCGWSFHLGYRIHLGNWFAITPVVGYACTGTNSVNGYKYNVTSSGISNSCSYNTTQAFDYGGMATFIIAKNFELYMGGTTHGFNIGLGFNFGSF